MSVDVVKGQKIDITKINAGLNTILVDLGWKAPTGMEVDASAFLLLANGKVSKDEDLVFYGNPSDSKGSVTYLDRQSNNKQIKIALSAVPQEIQKIAFSITIYEATTRKQNFGGMSNIYLRILNNDNQIELCKLDLGNSLTVENALVVGELYRHNGEWKFNAIGSGFDGGLSALCNNFGIVVNEQPKQEKKEPPKEKVSSKINLNKIELTKKGETINLVKTTGKLGEVSVRLNWNQNQNKNAKPSGGFLSSLRGNGSKSIDLDLGCLYELKNGTKGVVQALGNAFGSLQMAPYISLDGDDRTGAVSNGENLRINGDKLSEFKCILVYTFIYEGIANWNQADGVVTLKQPSGPDIIVALDEHDTSKKMCAIALIENVNDQTLSVKRLVQFFNGHSDMDKEFNWGLRWVAGKK